jgi:hypothetical protein
MAKAATGGDGVDGHGQAKMTGELGVWTWRGNREKEGRKDERIEEGWRTRERGTNTTQGRAEDEKRTKKKKKTPKKKRKENDVRH